MANHYAAMTHQKEHGNNQLLKKLLLSHPYAIIALLLLSLFGTLFSLAIPLIMGQLIDNVLVGKKISLLVPIVLLMSGLFLISALSSYYSNNIRGKLNLLLFKDLASDLFLAVQEASLTDLQKMKTGDLMTRTVGNTNAAVQTVTSIIPQIVVTVFGVVLPFMIMFVLNARLAVIASCPIILFIISSVYYGNRIQKYQRNSLDTTASMNSFLKEAFSIVPLTKVFLLEKWIHNKFETHMTKFFDTSLDVVKVTSMSSSTGMIIYGIPTLLILTFGSMDVLDGSMSIGTFTAFIGYIGLFFSPIQMLAILWTSYKGSQASFDRIEEVLSLKKESWGESALPPAVEKIEFDRVWFRYDTRDILKDFSATFLRGRNYLIGENGSGKSTVIKLLCGLYRPDLGRISFDGQDLCSLKRESLRNAVSVVFPDALVFDGSIYENILIGNLSASREEIENAARLADLHEFVMKLPERYDTNAGESGLALSSGERQKIALARVILRNSPIVIFDEFTRSIDIDAKRAIYEIIKKLDNKIIIIITHDMNDIEIGGRVVTLDRSTTRE